MSKITIAGYSISTDVKSPEISNSNLSVYNKTQTGFSVHYVQAVDMITNQSSLIYKLYKSNTNNISSISNVESNGIFITSSSGISGVQTSSLDINNLIQSQSIWVNVSVEDLNGNKTAYTPKYITTLVGSVASVFDSTFDSTFL